MMITRLTQFVVTQDCSHSNHTLGNDNLVGGFNHLEKYQIISQWEGLSGNHSDNDWLVYTYPSEKYESQLG